MVHGTREVSLVHNYCLLFGSFCMSYRIQVFYFTLVGNFTMIWLISEGKYFRITPSEVIYLSFSAWRSFLLSNPRVSMAPLHTSCFSNFKKQDRCSFSSLLACISHFIISVWDAFEHFNSFTQCHKRCMFSLPKSSLPSVVNFFNFVSSFSKSTLITCNQCTLYKVSVQIQFNSNHSFIYSVFACSYFCSSHCSIPPHSWEI